MPPTAYPPNLYRSIVANQTESEWEHKDEILFLRDWGERIIRELGMRVKVSEYLPIPLIQIRKLNQKTLGEYLPSPDGYAIAGTIILNEKRLPELDRITKVTLLLTLLFRAWEVQRCRDDVFQAECRQRVKEAGLSITKRGITIERGGRFHELLKKNRKRLKLNKDEKIKIPVGPVLLPKPLGAGRSTNSLWSCTCQRARVGTEKYLALCTNCGHSFQRGDHVGKRYLETHPESRKRIAEVLKDVRRAKLELAKLSRDLREAGRRMRMSSDTATSDLSRPR